MPTTSEKLSAIKPVIRLALTNPDTDSHSEFGRGIANLCQGVKEFGSLNAAAKNMGMAYSKAWRIVKETEMAIGFDLLDRDGAHGSALTDNGEALLDAYLKLDAKMQSYAESQFVKLLK